MNFWISVILFSRLVARVYFWVWHISGLFYLSDGNDVLPRFPRLFWNICILYCCSIASPGILSQSTLCIQDNQGTGGQLVTRPWQPESKLHLRAYSGAITKGSLMRTWAICSRPLNNVCMDVGCWFVQPPAFVFTGQSGDFAHTLLSGPLAKVIEMYQHFMDLESTFIFWKHVSTFLLDIWPHGIMESILNLNLGV